MKGREVLKTFFKKYNLEYFIFIFPMIVLFFIFFIIPFMQSFYFSLTNWSGISAHPKFIGFRNFIYIFTKDSDFWMSFKFTIKFTVLSVVLINVVTLLLARILTKGILFEKRLRIIFFIPNALSIAIVGIIWNFILGPLMGELLSKTGFALFGAGWLTNPSLALLSVVVATLWGALGWYTLIYVAGFEAVPVEYSEAAKIDGCTSIGEFIHITLPMIVPSITVCVFLTIINGLKVFDLLWSMTKGGPGKATESVIMNIYNTSFNTFLYGYGIAKSLILIIAIAVTGMLQVYFTKKKEVTL